MAAAPAPLEPHECGVDYEGWSTVYQAVKEMCAFSDAIEFLRANPGAANNRSGGGATLLHQAAYWGVDRGIYESLKECGADPTIRDKGGHLPPDCCEGPQAKANAEAAILEVFGADDASARVELLNAAKEANFASVMAQLRRRPYLVNTQSHRGWTVLHQFVYHGAGQRLVSVLLDLKASLELRNDERQTPVDLLRALRPTSDLRLPGREAVPLQPGGQVQVQLSGGPVQGVLQGVTGSEATVRCQDGNVVTAASWRVSVVRAVAADGEVFDKTCSVCCSPVAPHWQLSKSCTGPEHLWCGDCAASFLWSCYNSYDLPMRCVCCKVPVDPAAVPANLPRVFIQCWPPGKNEGYSPTTMSFPEFLDSVRERITQNHTQDDIQWKLEWLANSPKTDKPVAYCKVPDAYKYRACPQCGVIIEYESQCKHFDCYRCKHKFCWLCLRSKDDHPGDEWSFSKPCPVAPIQTAIASLPAPGGS